ncbi:MAG TPA: tRNA lysidine(34) synthetase TilS, partial [Candidatus Saccharimonadales bacterium]|nr:tRNA lysidine(34) synthetase TilS [Candidatus Saccharimonadales bacterium]
MEVTLPKGKYVLAVSGGVDSVSLLHALKDRPGVELAVAHYDHGIRPDSTKDRRFVQKLADAHGLRFIYEEGGLGPGASEAEAREARYGFLERARQQYRARAIVTAHHRDDVLETAVINLMRGSGRKGLTALASRQDMERPLLDVSKEEIIAYAKEHGLEWSDDPTNLDTDYLRNYVRHKVLPRFSRAERDRLW